ncbi:MAG TPA: hypothetical protein EYQ50_24480 [Verrucomicrobiales bacterium]|nr:hypothetical protein [Verrucomicrobiales bacterium]
MILFLTTVSVFGCVIFIMAIGVMVGGRRIKGSCGGVGGCDFCLLKGREKCDGNSNRLGEKKESGASNAVMTSK